LYNQALGKKMLLTGFQSYGGRATNPAEDVVTALDGEKIAGRRVTGRTLPVNYAELGPRIAQLITATAPQAVICLGLWPGEPMLRLERIAVNIADFEIADNVGAIERGAVVENGPAAYGATLPIHAIQDRLLDAGIPARLSGSAGNFLCNALMYHALRACAGYDPVPACGFIHLPYLPQQVRDIVRDTRDDARLELHQRGDLASMALVTMVEAIRLAIRTTIETRT
jgi:pyroglutamyl-peptidase